MRGGNFFFSVRQIGILTVRLQVQGRAGASAQMGPMVGFRIGSDASSLAPELIEGQRVVVLLSANCSPCQDILEEMAHGVRPSVFDDSQLLLLIEGSATVGKAQLARIPDVKGFVGVEAERLANLLGMSATPSALLLEAGTVKGTMFLNRVPELDQLLSGSVNEVEGPIHSGEPISMLAR